jgi:tetratricopeptide (TPR) repeat protein
MLDKKEISNKILEAYDCHNKREFVEAKEKYEKILEIDSENFDANHLLGILLIEIQDFKIAEKYLAKSISINPIIPAAYNNLGISLKEGISHHLSGCQILKLL